MDLLKRAAMYLSLALISVARTARHFLAVLRGDKAEGVRIIIFDTGRVLLLRHWYAPWVWTLPGGGIDRGEDAQRAAVRETREETGLIVRSIENAGTDENVHLFVCKSFEGTLAIRPNIEIMTRRWFDINNLPAEISPSHLRHIETYRSEK